MVFEEEVSIAQEFLSDDENPNKTTKQCSKINLYQTTCVSVPGKMGQAISPKNSTHSALKDLKHGYQK